jgi:anti-anti-sigma factor
MSTPPPFEVQTEPGRVVVSGELDLETVPVLREAIDGAGELTLDLRDVCFIDSTGLSLLLEVCDGREGMSILASEPVTRLAELCGLQDRLPLRA